MDRYPVQAQEEHCSRTSWLSPPSRSSKGNFHSVSGCLLAKCAKMYTILKAGVAQSAEQRFCKPQVGGSMITSMPLHQWLAYGAGERNRTSNLRFTKPLLCRLSYASLRN